MTWANSTKTRKKFSGKDLKRFKAQFLLEDGILFRRIPPVTEPNFHVFIQQNLIHDILHIAHDVISFSHFGIYKTILNKPQNVYWPNLIPDTYGYLRSCYECQTM